MSPETAYATPAPTSVEDIPKITGLLRELADVSLLMATSSESLIYARRAHDNTSARYAELMNSIAKEREQNNV